MWRGRICPRPKIKTTKGASEEAKQEYAGINTVEFVEATDAELRNYIRETYDGFKGKFDDFKYKHGEKLKNSTISVILKLMFVVLKLEEYSIFPVKQKEEQSAFKQKTVVSHLLDRWDIGYHGTLVPIR